MRELATVTQEMEAQGKRLSKLLKVHKLDTMARGEFCELVAVVDRLMVNLTDFNALHFSPLLYRGCARAKQTAAAAAGAQTRRAKERKASK